MLHMDEHGFLKVPGMAVDLFMDYIELFWIHWVFCGGAVKVHRGGALKFSLTLSPNDLPDSSMYALVNFGKAMEFGGTALVGITVYTFWC